MKEYTNPNGVTIKRGDKFTAKHAHFTVERIYRNRLGVIKVLTTNGVIFDADGMKKAVKKDDTKDTE